MSSVGNQIFRQEIGIRMGTDCAPYLANLFLFVYEFDFMNTKLKKKILRLYENSTSVVDTLMTC